MENWRYEIEKLLCYDSWCNCEIAKLNAPKNLYKYKVVNDYTINSIREDKMWITTPKYFNDPYDCALFIDSSNIKNKFFETDDLADLDKELEPYKLEGKMIEAKSRIKELEPEFEKLKEQLAIACLTEDNDNILM
ncbi:TPA: hypothetical protein ACSQWB_000962 [Clostridium perfringens]|uniref:hypothetical protein n=1 Tax=Clostridium perfringens TaxID=1502 RepID=UPI001D6832ED|nr:hypothetical protein [Clostridium perfringens]EIF5083526.1 hypothetical protein [Clostridium perfringens]